MDFLIFQVPMLTLQATLDGVLLGILFALIAYGMALQWGVMNIINIAQGDLVILGGYIAYFMYLWGIHPAWGVIVSPFIMYFVGVGIYKLVINKVVDRDLFISILATFGISLILQQTVRSVFSPLNRQVISPSWLSGSLEINPVFSLTYNRLYILAFAIIVLLCLQLVLKKTKLGLQVRAVSQNRAMARSMGVRTERVDALTFGLGAGVAGVAGVALSQLTNVGPNLGQAYIVDSFMVVVFGGVGNLWGTMVGGFTLGIANKFLEPMTGPVLANIFVLIFIILFIQKRPSGLFPQRGRATE